MKRQYDDLEVACRSCEHAELLVDSDIVLCEKRGVVSAGASCKKFVYDALKRTPPKRAEAPTLEFVDLDK